VIDIKEKNRSVIFKPFIRNLV